MIKIRYLLDTVIISDHFNGMKKATNWLSRIKEGEAAISVVTLAELFVGISKEEEDSVFSFVDKLECFSIDAKIALLAAELRQKWKWKLPDAFQAAVALENNLTLVTRNTRDFSSKKHKFVKIPY